MKKQNCGGKEDKNEVPVVSRVVTITDEMTVADLRKIPLADVVAELVKGLPTYSATAQLGPMGNIFFNDMNLAETGAQIPAHAHNHDHVTYLTRGSLNVLSWEVDKNGEKVGEAIERNYKAPAPILIKKSMAHQLTAIEPNSHSVCIFALRDFDGQVIDYFNGDAKAYQ